LETLGRNWVKAHQDCPLVAELRLRASLRALAGLVLLLGLFVAGIATALFAVGVLGTPLEGIDPEWRLFHLALVVPGLWLSAIAARWGHVPQPASRGVILAADEAPRLHQLVARFAAHFSIRRPIVVRIVASMNAAVVQRLALSPLRIETELQLGLPLLMSTTPDRFQAILAHEFGHLKQRDGRIAAIAACLRAWWHRALEQIDSDPSLMGQAMSRVLTRTSLDYLDESIRLCHAEEYEADARAAEAVGADALARALIELALAERFLHEDYFRKVEAQADARRRPRMLPYGQMAAAVHAGFNPLAMQRLIDAEAESETGLGTHPTIRQRCARLLEHDAAIAPLGRPGPRLAAEHYLAPVLAELAAFFDRAWWVEHGPGWEARHKAARAARRRVRRLEGKRSRTDVEALELACLVERYFGERDPLAHYMALLGRDCPQPAASLAVGRLLCERGDRGGEEHLRRASQADSEVGLAASMQLFALAQERGGDDAEVEQHGLRAGALLLLGQQVRAELPTDIAGAGWLGAGLDRVTLRRVADLVQVACPGLKRAYLVRRVPRCAPQWASYALLLRGDFAMSLGYADLAAAVEEIAGDGCAVLVRVVRRGTEWERRALEVRGGLIVQRPAQPAARPTGADLPRSTPSEPAKARPRPVSYAFSAG
jgi:Zn-dependent protease with chaperone function